MKKKRSLNVRESECSRDGGREEREEEGFVD